MQPSLPQRDVVARRLLEHAEARWRAIGCTRGLVYALSSEEAATYRAVGFEPHNAMVIELGRPQSPSSPLDLGRRGLSPARGGRQAGAEAPLAAEGAELTAIDEAFVAAIRLSNAELAQQWSPQYLASLRLALPQMADAVLADSQAGRALRAAAPRVST